MVSSHTSAFAADAHLFFASKEGAESITFSRFWRVLLAGGGFLPFPLRENHVQDQRI